jgi:hypothetical protein
VQLGEAGTGAGEDVVGPDPGGQRIVRHQAGPERHDVAAAVVGAERRGRPRDALLAQVPQEPLDGRAPRAGRAADGVTGPDRAAHGAAGQDFLVVDHRRAR